MSVLVAQEFSQGYFKVLVVFIRRQETIGLHASDKHAGLVECRYCVVYLSRKLQCFLHAYYYYTHLKTTHKYIDKLKLNHYFNTALAIQNTVFILIHTIQVITSTYSIKNMHEQNTFHQSFPIYPKFAYVWAIWGWTIYDSVELWIVGQMIWPCSVESIMVLRGLQPVGILLCVACTTTSALTITLAHRGSHLSACLLLMERRELTKPNGNRQES